jgi:hypothetical protein
MIIAAKNCVVHEFLYSRFFLFVNVDMANHVVYECHYRKCWFINVAVENNYFCMNMVMTTVFAHKCGHGK